MCRRIEGQEVPGTRIGVDPTVDVVFKKIFASPHHENVTQDFLNSLLPLTGVNQVQTLKILNPFRLSEFQDEKEIVVDVHAQDSDGREFQIEMQVRRDLALPTRMLDNWARLYSAQIEKGEDYRRHRPVISIWILSLDLWSDEEWLHVFGARDRNLGISLGGDFLIVTVELAKWERLSANADRATLGTPLDQWLWFLAHGKEVDPEGEAFAGLRGAIREAAEMMREFTKKDKARYTHDRRLEAERVHNAMMADARAEGLEEGRAEGRTEGIAEGMEKSARETAKALKELGVDVDVIVKATKLSRTEVEGL